MYYLVLKISAKVCITRNGYPLDSPHHYRLWFAVLITWAAVTGHGAALTARRYLGGILCGCEYLVPSWNALILFLSFCILSSSFWSSTSRIFFCQGASKYGLVFSPI